MSLSTRALRSPSTTFLQSKRHGQAQPRIIPFLLQGATCPSRPATYMSAQNCRRTASFSCQMAVSLSNISFILRSIIHGPSSTLDRRLGSFAFGCMTPP